MVHLHLDTKLWYTTPVHLISYRLQVALGIAVAERGAGREKYSERSRIFEYTE